MRWIILRDDVRWVVLARQVVLHQEMGAKLDCITADSSEDDNVHHAETHVSHFITRKDCSACFLVTEVLALLAPSFGQLVKHYELSSQ